MTITDKSQELFMRSQKILVGGVNSPVRAFRVVGGIPRFIARAEGSRLWDVDGNSYIDYVCSWGPMLLGHADPAVRDAVCAAVERGTSFGAPTAAELALAELVQEFYPSIEKIRFTSSGTEACMGAIRAARGFTGRDKIIKFEGCYHGHADYLLVRAGSGASTLGEPDSAGVPASFVEHTISLPYNDPDAVAFAFNKFPDQIAAVIVEPVAGNMGLVLPMPGFLQALREQCSKHGAVLIFDEVLVGFRIPFGAQGFFKVNPDLTCLGKVLGGGFPVGAYGGRKEIMACVSPEGPVYQAGTLSGNPVAMAAGIATLTRLKQHGLMNNIILRTKTLAEGLRTNFRKAGLPYSVSQIGSMFCMFFTESMPINYEQAKKADVERFRKFFHAMLEAGIYLAPSCYETAFVSTAHSEEDINKTLKAQADALASLT